MNPTTTQAQLIDPRALRIILRRLKVHASIGILPHETRLTQPLLCNADVWVLQEGPAHDRIGEVLDYRLVRETLVRCLTSGHTNLLETLTERAVSELCLLPHVTAVRLHIEKPNAFDDAEAVGIELFRHNPRTERS
jgi:7,8-dihydroneopterin aldolase/epimerase/oxygenase